VLHFGSQVADDAFILTEQDAEREIDRLKRDIQRLGRLKGVKVVYQGGQVVTCYRPNKRGQKTALRRLRATK
jgi:hypothetical protein